ncbi:unnamed protein product [Brachionus calyciflorus]|uniref:MULE transposase domain-containing protein n=1 Tax=Brachionus calyciflorus TaxID=104777 RepID=A0A814BRS0_9BILA|nr:unnamed protein product [Brachionus calyciflorus]
MLQPSYRPVAAKKALKPIYNYEFKHEILIADRAETIINRFINTFNYKSGEEFSRVMCWAHAHQTIETRTKSIDESLRSQIRNDSNLIHLSTINVIKTGRGRGVKYTTILTNPRYPVELWSIHDRILNDIPLTTNHC